MKSVPIRYEPAYQDTLTWLIEEFTELRGGCTVNENVGGYYLSQSKEVIDDRVSVVYSDFPMNWNKQTDRNEALDGPFAGTFEHVVFAIYDTSTELRFRGPFVRRFG